MIFFDEARLGLKPVTGRLWAMKGARPLAAVCPGYGNFYVYSAVCPATGEDVTLFMPRVNTGMMNLFLGELGKALGGRRCLLVMDRAGWHRSAGLDVPENIEIVLLPPYSPELNPVERLWAWLKRHALRNRLMHTLDEVMDSLEDAMRRATPDFLKSICRCNYLSHQK